MKKHGFTLAEVLITLGIIGVVAAITLPTLMSNTVYKQLGTKLSKFHSTFENNTLAYVAANSTFDELVFNTVNLKDLKTGETTSNTTPSSADVKKAIEDYINEVFIFNTVYTAENTESDDLNLSVEKGFGGTPKSQGYPKGVLKDGTSISVGAVEYVKGGTLDIRYIDTDLYSQDKYGSMAFLVNFAPNVKGLPQNGQTTFEFVVTTKGFVLPMTDDGCLNTIVDNDYNVKSSFYKEGNACYKTNDTWLKVITRLKG